MSLDKVKFFIIPKNCNETELAWLVETRKYIQRFQARQMYKELLLKSPIQKVSPEEWIAAKNKEADRNIYLTIYIAAPDYDNNDITHYLSNPETKDLGLALAIEFEDFEKFFRSDISLNQLIIYLENNILSDDDISLIKSDKEFIKGIFDRIIDKDKIMYHNLQNNFLNIIKECQVSLVSDILTSKKIATYIEHANFYNSDELLKYILTYFSDNHPDFSKQHFMHWDSFTRSRYFSKWLKSKGILCEISKYYLDLPPANECIKSNQDYIKKFLEYKNIIGES